MTFCSPCNLFIMLNKMLWLLGSDSSLHFCRGRQSSFFFSLFLFFLIQLIIEALSVFGGPSYMILLAHNNSEGIIYKSQLKWGRKKKSSHLLKVVQFIIYTCTGIRWVSLCVMSHQGCNICLAGFRDATPHLVAVGNVHYCSGTVSGINWEQGEKNSVARFCFA